MYYFAYIKYENVKKSRGGDKKNAKIKRDLLTVFLILTRIHFYQVFMAVCFPRKKHKISSGQEFMFL